MCDPPRIYLSLTVYRPTLLFNKMYMCDPPRIYPSLTEYTPFSTTICDPLGIYPSLSEYTPLLNNYIIMRPSQNLTLPPRIYPPFQPLKYYATLPEYTLPPRIYPPFQQMYMCDPPRIYPSLTEYTPFSTTICDPLGIYPSLSEYTPLLNNYNIMRPSQNLTLPPRIYPPFQPLKYYATLPEYTPLFNKCICATLPESTPPSQNIPPFQQLYATLSEYTPLLNNYNIMRPSQNLTLPPRIYPPFQPLKYYATLPEYTLPPRIYPPFQQMYMCDPPRIYPSLPEYTPIFDNYFIMRRSQILYLPPSQNIPPFQQLYVTLPENTNITPLRNGFQVIADANLIIRDVEARWPGSTHDSYMLRQSNVNRQFEEKKFGRNWLLGDSGYPCKTWLLTPLANPRTPA